MNYNKYPKYKNSGIAWLGEIPEEWDLQKIMGITKTYSIKNRPNEELLSVYRDYGVIIKSSRDDNHNKPGLDLSNNKYVFKGALVLNKMKTWQGSLGVSEYEGIVSPAYITCKVDFNEVEGEFLNYLLRCNNYIFEYNRLSYGVRPSQWDMRYDDFKNIPVFLPPKPEQTAIANFLDYKLKKIDRFISKKKQLIELLNEQKAAIINHAVTKGLNPNVKMKDSGIEWLGDIPEHWDVKKLKFVANCFPSNIDKHSKDDEEQVRLCNYTDVYKNYFITNEMDLMIATAKDEQIEKFTLLKNDVIITKDSETADDIANPALVTEQLENVVCGYHLSVLRPYKILDGGYLFRALQCKPINVQFELTSLGVTRVGLGVYDMKSAKIPVPPKEEQKEIFNHIKTEISKITKTITTIEIEISLVEEYKTALIAEAVTGKIDVREYEIPGKYQEDSCEDLSIAAEGISAYRSDNNK